MVPWAYLTWLFVLPVLSLTRSVALSYPEVILVLAPGPFLFRQQIGELIRAWRITRIGPIELQEPLRGVSAVDQAQFVALDQHFVTRTKTLLYWLSRNGTVSRTSFNITASQLQVPEGNVETTWNAIVASGCAVADGQNLTITEIGKRYVAHLFSGGA
jgi:hypothetical protein